MSALTCPPAPSPAKILCGSACGLPACVLPGFSAHSGFSAPSQRTQTPMLPATQLQPRHPHPPAHIPTHEPTSDGFITPSNCGDAIFVHQTAIHAEVRPSFPRLLCCTLRLHSSALCEIAGCISTMNKHTHMHTHMHTQSQTHTHTRDAGSHIYVCVVRGYLFTWAFVYVWVCTKGFRSLKEEEPVECNISDNGGKTKAVDVTGPGGAYVQGAPRRTRGTRTSLLSLTSPSSLLIDF